MVIPSSRFASDEDSYFQVGTALLQGRQDIFWPPVTGWYAEFGDLHAPPGGIGYTSDAMRFMGATFDPSARYRFTAVRRMLADNQLRTAHISAQVRALQQRLIDAVAETPLGYAELLNPLDGPHHARFLAFRNSKAQRWCAELLANGAPGIHFYTLNRSPATRAILSALRLMAPWRDAVVA